MADGAKPKYRANGRPSLKRHPPVPDELKKQPANPGAGRPAMPIDWEQVAKWVIAGSSGTQCAAQIGMSCSAFYERCQKDINMLWSEFYDQYREKGNRMLNTKQFDLAMKGDKTMLVWLGKQRLKQTEKIDQKIESKTELTQKAILELPDNGRRMPS